MPDDAVPVSEGPQQAWQWVLEGGLTPEDATDVHGFMWHEATRRVLIPIKNNNVIVSLLGRAVFGEHPKYRVISGAADSFYRSPTCPSKTTVVVEDVLSAIAVGRAGVNALAVLGTAITPAHAREIATNTDRVIGWFDPDDAGQKAWLRLRSRMQLYPVTLSQIQSKHDPKNLHRQQLKDMLHLGA